MVVDFNYRVRNVCLTEPSLTVGLQPRRALSAHIFCQYCRIRVIFAPNLNIAARMGTPTSMWEIQRSPNRLNPEMTAWTRLGPTN